LLAIRRLSLKVNSRPEKRHPRHPKSKPSNNTEVTPKTYGYSAFSSPLEASASSMTDNLQPSLGTWPDRTIVCAILRLHHAGWLDDWNRSACAELVDVR
jgi:hypothetical protein